MTKRVSNNKSFVFIVVASISLNSFSCTSKMVTLYSHQEEAVAWMTQAEARPRMVFDQPHGGILAHAMGLGKTLSMLSFIRAQPPGVTIVVCPKSLLLQWGVEAARVGFTPEDVTTYHGNTRVLPPRRADAHQLVLTTFDIVRLELPRRSLHDVIWDRVVLDEAHRICEQTSKTARAVQALRARNRWCVTGTPFKNGISDLMALSKFLLVAPYCTTTWWRWYSHSVPKLREWRRLFLHMRDKSVLSLLPIKHHNIQVSLPGPEKQLMAELGVAKWKVRVEDARDVHMFTPNHDQHELLRILRQRQAANHPMLLTPLNAMKHLMESESGDATASKTACVACALGPAVTRTCSKHALCATCGEEPVCAVCIAHTLRESVPSGWMHSTKTLALWTYLCDVANIRAGSTKVVLFSQWTTCLDMLGWMLDFYNIRYARYDGRVNTTEEREQVLERFRTETECQVLLTSLGAGGEGVNLAFASHVVLMEPYWNLGAEQQAIDRLHRIGQEGTTHVMRLQVVDSVEEWVQSIQVRKRNELQRLLFEKIVGPVPEPGKDNGNKGTKRALTTRSTCRIEDESPASNGFWDAFLMHPCKQIKVG